MDRLRSALILLQQYAGSRVEVEGLAPRENGALPVRIAKRGGGAPTEADLVPWSGTTSPAAFRRRLWVLRNGSSVLRAELRESGESFVDLAGAIHLDLPGLLVDRSDLPPLRAERGALHDSADPFADRASMVPRLLLDDPARSWGVRELANAAGTGLGSTSRVVRALERMGLVRSEREGRASRITPVGPMRLFLRWTGSYDWSRNSSVAFHAPMGSPERFLPRLPEALEGRRWALTLHAGASLLAPHAMWDRVHLYVDAPGIRELAAVGRSAGWTPAAEGRVVLMRPFYRTSVWHAAESVRGIPVVPPLQLALDLWHHPLRGREQAEHLIHTILRWEDAESGA